jgi:hypothetical protein
MGPSQQQTKGEMALEETMDKYRHLILIIMSVKQRSNI